ncbi:hypothetical protein LX36DRAFT_73810 [Colletotrichum falcatum]|nr:hypothetical protein LX36DRAFT_73810 [Colletotrichum falcatum]
MRIDGFAMRGDAICLPTRSVGRSIVLGAISLFFFSFLLRYCYSINYVSYPPLWICEYCGSLSPGYRLVVGVRACVVLLGWGVRFSGSFAALSQYTCKLLLRTDM